MLDKPAIFSGIPWSLLLNQKDDLNVFSILPLLILKGFNQYNYTLVEKRGKKKQPNIRT
jgi:hypothetical protein